MTLTTRLNTLIDAALTSGLTPVSVILNYNDHRMLSAELDGLYTQASPYYQFVPRYRGLSIIRPGLAYDGAPAVGVTA